MARRIEKKDIVQGNIFEDLNKQLAESKIKFDSLTTSINALEDVLTKLKNEAKGVKGAMKGIDVTTPKGAKEFNDKQKEANKIMLDSIKIQREKIKLEADQERLKQSQLRTEKALNSEKKKTLTAYQEESKRLGELRQRYKDLAVQQEKGVKLTKEESREMKALSREIKHTDAMLKKVDESTGQHFRSVGNYEKALGGVKNMLGQLGVAFGVFELVRGAGATIVDFENNLASFRTIVSDLSDKEFEKFKNKIGEVATKTKASAVDVAKSFENIAGLNAEFAETAEGLSAVSESAITLSKASGDELGASTENLVGIMNQFSMGAEESDRAINVLAAGQAVGAASISNLAESFKNVGSVASSSNISLEQSVGLLEVLGKFNLKGAEAGTKLRGVILQLQKAGMGYASGQFNINDALAEYNEKLKGAKTEAEKNALAQKVFGAENITAGKILTQNIPLIEKYTKGVTGTNEAMAQAEIKSNTLLNKWNELKNAMANMVVNATSSGGALDSLKTVLGFLAENLTTIVGLVVKLGASWLVYKTSIIAVTTAQKLMDGGIKDLVKGLFSMKKAQDENASSSQKLGSSLKGIGWTSLIALAFQFGYEIWRIASGAAQAEENLKRMEKTLNKAKESTDKTVERINNKLADRLRIIEQQRTSGVIKSEAEYLKLKKEAVEMAKQEYMNNIKLVRARKDNYLALKKELAVVYQQGLKEFGQTGGVSEKTYQRLQDIGKAIGMTGDKSFFGLIQMGVNVNDVLAQLNSNVKASGNTIVEYKKQVHDLDMEMGDYDAELLDITKNSGDYDAELEDITKNSGKFKEGVEKQTKSLRELLAEFKNADALLKLHADQSVIDEIAVYEAEKDVEKAFEYQKELIEKTGAYQLDVLEKRIEAEYQLKRAILDRKLAEVLNSDASVGDKEEAQLLHDFEIGKLEEESFERRKQMYKELEEAQEVYSEKNKQVAEKEEETAKKSYEEQRKWIDLTTDYLKKNIDERIALLDKQVEASKKQEEALQELANNGNIKAQESIVRERELQREALAEKQKLERRKQYLEMASAFLKSYTQKLEQGKSGMTAISEALAEKVTLEAIINGLPSFYEGTNDLGKVSNPLDANGGRLIVAHDNERIMTKEQNEALGLGLSNWDLVKFAQIGMESTAGMKNIGESYMLNALGGKIDHLIQAIENKPENHYDVNNIVEGVVQVVKTEKRARQTVKTRTQYRA